MRSYSHQVDVCLQQTVTVASRVCIIQLWLLTAGLLHLPQGWLGESYLLCSVYMIVPAISDRLLMSTQPHACPVLSISSFYAMGGLHLSCMNSLAAYHCTAAAEACSPRPPFSQVHQDEASPSAIWQTWCCGCLVWDVVTLGSPVYYLASQYIDAERRSLFLFFLLWDIVCAL